MLTHSLMMIGIMKVYTQIVSIIEKHKAPNIPEACDENYNNDAKGLEKTLWRTQSIHMYIIYVYFSLDYHI